MTNEYWQTVTEKYMEPLDIVGYNYRYTTYQEDHERYPNRVIWGSEAHAVHFYESWQEVKNNPYIIGDFTWTAYDNLGEAGTGRYAWAREGVIKGISLAEYPWRTCFQGDLDLCGYRRPQSYFTGCKNSRSRIRTDCSIRKGSCRSNLYNLCRIKNS